MSSKPKPQISQALYVKEPECPYCGHTLFTFGKFNYDDPEHGPWQRATCDSCKRSWKELFTLTGFKEESQS